MPRGAGHGVQQAQAHPRPRGRQQPHRPEPPGQVAGRRSAHGAHGQGPAAGRDQLHARAVRRRGRRRGWHRHGRASRTALRAGGRPRHRRRRYRRRPRGRSCRRAGLRLLQRWSFVSMQGHMCSCAQRPSCAFMSASAVRARRCEVWLRALGDGVPVVRAAGHPNYGGTHRVPQVAEMSPAAQQGTGLCARARWFSAALLVPAFAG